MNNETEITEIQNNKTTQKNRKAGRIKTEKVGYSVLKIINK